MGSNTGFTLALLATLLLRSVVAPGYMPSASGDGGLVALCHSGLPAGVLQSGTAGHDHSGHAADHAPASTPELTSDDLCPLGDALSVAVLLPAGSPGVSATGPIAVTFDSRRPDPITRSPSGFSARAPPFETV